MASEERKSGSGSGPLFAVLALAGVAGVAYLAYRRLATAKEPKIGSLLEMADRASKALEKRIDEFAIAS
jgi:hypothetical protein